MKRFLIAANLLAIGIVLAFVAAEYGGPIAAKTIWAAQYKKLMFKCDHAMREHYIAKRAVAVSPSAVTVKNLKAAEVSLLDCHHYDKMRKKLLAWGVGENQISAIGLEALEEKKYDLRRFVGIHEIRY